ncbi:MAG: MFS transporter [Mycobacterium sp.]|nr:MFS transporter [Mycobacterium sp.]
MTAPVTPTSADPRDRRARAAVGLLFLSNGTLFAGLLPRYPEIKAQLALSNTAFGLSVGAFAAGALLSGLTAGALIRRIGSARVAVATSLLVALCTFAAAVATVPAAFAAALFAAGAADAVTDVAQNAHGLRVQRNYGRSIINSLHAVWSAGAVLGGLLGAGAIALGVSRAAQLGMTGIVFATACLVGYRFLLRGPDEPETPASDTAGAGRPTSRTWALIGMLALLAIAGAAVEDAGSSWASLYLSAELHAPVALAAFGYVALVGFQFVGRLVGDRLVDRFGERAVVRCGGLLAGAGMAAALAAPAPVAVPVTICGFAAAGFGVASVAPAAFHGADTVPGLRPGSGLTAVTWFMRVGFLAAPALVGAVADAAGLRVGLVIVPLAGLLIAVSAEVLPRHVPGTTARRAY